MLNLRSPEEVKLLANDFTSANPFKWLVIDNFFDLDTANRLLDEFPRCANPETLLNEFGAPNPKATVSDVPAISKTYQELDHLIQTSQFLDFIESITGINGLKYDPYYYGAGTHENFHTAGLDPHFDFNLHPITRQHRRLNLIIYLNKGWEAGWGGHICLHKNPYDIINDEVIEIEPVFNRAIIFETNEVSWHSVKPVDHPSGLLFDASRKSFTIYYYTDDRPNNEAAPEHGTVYVQPNLPPHIKAGYTLNDHDIGLIQQNILRRNNYLQALYKREYQFSERITELRNSLDVALKSTSIQLPIWGNGRAVAVHTRIFDDICIEDNMSFDVLVEQELSIGMDVTCYIPDNLFSHEQVITVSVKSKNTPAAESRQANAPSGMITLSIPFLAEKGDLLTVDIASKIQMPAGGDDKRSLSIKLDSIHIY